MTASPIILGQRKAAREITWSILIAVILILGLMGSILGPSLAYSLQAGLSNYANAQATYIIVQNNGNPQFLNESIPSGVLQQIGAIPGVQTVYPVATTETYVFPSSSTPISYAIIDGKKVPVFQGETGYTSAVIGGARGYPESLVRIVNSSVSNSSINPAFVYNSEYDNPVNSSLRALVQVANVNFSSAEVGLNSYNPLIGNNLQILSNSTQLQNLLGPRLFNNTFGLNATTNLAIVKVNSVAQVTEVSQQIEGLVSNLNVYLVIYDQSTVSALLSLESTTAPLYNLIGVVSVCSMVLSLFFVSFLAAKRREWEIGLLKSQGWSWKDITNYFLSYFLILTALSFVLSTVASFVIVSSYRSSFEVYGGYIQVPVFLNLNFIILSALLAVVSTLGISFLMILRSKRLGIDRMLRDF